MTTETTRMASASHVASEGEASALPEATKLNLVFWILVTLVFVAGVVLRWTGLNRESLWADEGYTTWFSQFSPAAQWRLMPWETQAPIYHIWLHYWTAIWGTSVTSFRSLSAFFSTLSLGVVFLIARKMWSSRRLRRSRYDFLFGVVFSDLVRAGVEELRAAAVLSREQRLLAAVLS